MRRLRWLALVGLAAALTAVPAQAASPLDVDLLEAQAFENVLEDGDALFLARIHLVPTSSNLFTDQRTATISSGAFDNPVALTNRVVETSGTDFTVTDDTTGDDITDDCQLEQDLLSIDCANLSYGNGDRTVTINYRSGWDAYGGERAFLQVLDTGALVEQRNLPDVGYLLGGIYMTAAEVTSAGITFGDSNVTMRLIADPSLWESNDTQSQAITWNTNSTEAEMESELTAALRTMLRSLEFSDPAVTAGDYVLPDGITSEGAEVAQAAFTRISEAIAEAFLSGSFNPFNPLGTATPSYASQVEATATAAPAGSAFEDLGTEFGGFSGHAMGGIIFGVLAIAAMFGTGKLIGSYGLGLIAAWSIVGMGWLIGALPGLWFWMPTVLVGGFSVGILMVKIVGREA